MGVKGTDGVGTSSEVRVQSFGLDKTEGGHHGSLLSFVCIS